MATNKNKNENNNVNPAPEATPATTVAETATVTNPAPEANVPPVAAPVAEPAGPKMVTIRIPRTRADQEDVFVSVNNYTCIIQRGVEVEVPDYVAEVLRNQEKMLETIMEFESAVQQKGK